VHTFKAPSPSELSGKCFLHCAYERREGSVVKKVRRHLAVAVVEISRPQLDVCNSKASLCEGRRRSIQTPQPGTATAGSVSSQMANHT